MWWGFHSWVHTAAFLPVHQQGAFFFVYSHKIFLAVFQHPLTEQLNLYWPLCGSDEGSAPRCGQRKRSSWKCGNGFTVLPSLRSAVGLCVLVELSRWTQLDMSANGTLLAQKFLIIFFLLLFAGVGTCLPSTCWFGFFLVCIWAF